MLTKPGGQWEGVSKEDGEEISIPCGSAFSALCWGVQLERCCIYLCAVRRAAYKCKSFSSEGCSHHSKRGSQEQCTPSQPLPQTPPTAQGLLIAAWEGAPCAVQRGEPTRKQKSVQTRGKEPQAQVPALPTVQCVTWESQSRPCHGG